jgi:hypothetical protein
MKPKSYRRNKESDKSKAAADELMNMLFKQAKAQFGPAIKAFWFHDGDFCPGCAVRPIGAINFKGREALAINAFIYRERGVLIGYFLCETCATFIFKEAEKNPHTQTPLHADIERNLISAYHKHLSSLNA